MKIKLAVLILIALAMVGCEMKPTHDSTGLLKTLEKSKVGSAVNLDSIFGVKADSYYLFSEFVSGDVIAETIGQDVRIGSVNSNCEKLIGMKNCEVCVYVDFCPRNSYMVFSVDYQDVPLDNNQKICLISKSLKPMKVFVLGNQCTKNSVTDQ